MMAFKSVSVRKPGRTRQGVIMLQSTILLKLSTNAWYHNLLLVAKDKVKIFHSVGDTGPPRKKW